MGNCWLIAGINILLENKELFNRVFVTQNYSPEGCYIVRLCYQGIWQTVVLDDQFPCLSDGTLAFSKSVRKQLWVLLIEKAFAKLYGSYHRVESGFTTDAFVSLTGYPSFFTSFSLSVNNLNYQETMWRKLLAMKYDKYSFSVSTILRIPQNFGLVENHAYTLLNVKEVDGIRLLLIRNTWGYKIWQGEWSEQCSKWTPRLRSAFGFSQINTPEKLSQDGIFWIGFEDFLKYFQYVYVCKHRQNLYEQRISTRFLSADKKSFKGFRLKIFRKSSFYFSMFHPQAKKFVNNFMFLIVTLNEDFMPILEYASKNRFLCFLCDETKLNPGKYIIIPLALGNFSSWDENIYNYNMVFQSNREFELKKISYDSNLIVDCLTQLCLIKGVKNAPLRDANFYVLTNRFNGLVILGENLSKNFYYRIKVELAQYSDIWSSRGQLYTEDLIPPMHRQIICIVSLNSRDYLGISDYSIGSSFQKDQYFTFSYNYFPNCANYPHLNDQSRIFHSPQPIT